MIRATQIIPTLIGPNCHNILIFIQYSHAKTYLNAPDENMEKSGYLLAIMLNCIVAAEIWEKPPLWRGRGSGVHGSTLITLNTKVWIQASLLWNPIF